MDMALESAGSGATSCGELSKLGSAKSTARLNQIARLRANGIGDHIDLPQLVVCGDQSAGKSSVLEGITTIPFPRKDGVCTRFPTEIILQHREGPISVKASMIPHASRCDESKQKLRHYQRELDDLQGLPEVIAEVGELMGIRGFGNVENGPAFAADVLRITLLGPTGLHLSVVDLPGLIGVTNEARSDADLELVKGMVESYLTNPRTIILAVVQASNDVDNQRIIQLARQFDPQGERTVGIITKPDLINVGTEGRIALLARNGDTTKLRLGWFLLKNPTPIELSEGITTSEREHEEDAFFRSAPWKDQGLSPSRVGIKALRVYLQTLLDRHIEKELPKVREEIRALISSTEQELIDLGRERHTMEDLRAYLVELSMRFYNLVTAALSGTYDEIDTEFFAAANGKNRRLRALVHKSNGKFSNYMRDRSQKRKIVAGKGAASADQLELTKKEFDTWIKKMYLNSRGKELPGTYNHLLLSELFHEQSSRWESIASDHLYAVFDIISEVVKAALEHAAKDNDVQEELWVILDIRLRQNLAKAETELQELCCDERQQPITYNHYFTDNVQKTRPSAITREDVAIAIDLATSEESNQKMRVTKVNADKLLNAIQPQVIVNMDEQACLEATTALAAYYKVAMKTFVDNVCKQVIERHLLRDLTSVFSPPSVATLSDADLQRIAAEPDGNTQRRETLKSLLENLHRGFQDLRRQN
ncbi:MAG: hypothetical protein M1838_005315 [Thelocarpon superellum]|nr:MAG: hypothetical protein M1838_005315 [Thelocarpon superellum]